VAALGLLRASTLENPARAGTVSLMKYADRISFDPEQCGGRPCIRHYRIRVKDVLDMLAGEATHEEILEDYPFLEPADILACLEYAAEAPALHHSPTPTR
jgi:uncharacterized protein (DUF433 family)